MKTFITRLGSAIVFAVIVIGCLLFNKWTSLILLSIIMIGCIHELYTMSKSYLDGDEDKIGAYKLTSIALSFLMMMSLFYVGNSDEFLRGFVIIQWLLYIPIFIIPFFILELFLKSSNPIRNLSFNIMSIVYITIPMCLAMMLAIMANGAVVLGALITIWGNDSGAYIIGSLIGRHKLLPHISPNKSIEGFIGGGLFCLLAAYLLTNIFNQIPFMNGLDAIEPKVWYYIAGGVFLFATIGDLVESLFKRALGVKDSGAIMPGHGGFLDRFDAFLFTIPIIVAIITFFS